MLDSNTTSLIKNLSPKMDYEVSQLLTKKFIELERVLLNAEQFDIRIKFGTYIKQFSDVEIDRIKADIDYIGWTYVMMGELNKAEKSILNGIKRSTYLLNSNKNNINRNDLNKLIVRGYRHLGSARVTYENDPEKTLEYLELAYNAHKDSIK